MLNVKFILEFLILFKNKEKATQNMDYLSK
jgi:hypothetical protein